VISRFQSFPDIGACYAGLFPEAKRVYVSPDIDASAASNPYLRLLYRGLDPISLSAQYPILPLTDRLRGERGIWHQHWLQCSSLPTFLRAAHRLRAAQLYRKLGGHVLWTVHNLEPHVRRLPRPNAWLTRGMRETAEYLHVHSEQAAEQLCRAWHVPESRVVTVPHPSYEVGAVARTEARARLKEHYGIDLGETKVFLIFGMIARYKRIVEVISAFEGLPGARTQLLIAGAVRGNEADYAHEIAAAMKRGPVQLCDRFIPEEHVPWFFGAADVALFNYRQILTSGAIQLASDLGTPIWIPDLPALAGITADAIVRFEDMRELRERIELSLFDPSRLQAPADDR
jgi:glycosyltransferase involved in cell wall biosynthesis